MQININIFLNSLNFRCREYHFYTNNKFNKGIISFISLMRISLDELNFIGQGTERDGSEDRVQEPAWVLTLLSVSEEI